MTSVQNGGVNVCINAQYPTIPLKKGSEPQLHYLHYLIMFVFLPLLTCLIPNFSIPVLQRPWG